ncbi:dorsal-ventral patterning tolloid-like protein 1 [Stegodyphus dumicola]|uniref:dorsal-ventral patterning tolloid-like protein 1 n=1 Tax=Stegodyphus dumicola TaxID=202533 RepID=UPI0015ACB8AD|nr:dorsal-ventral patterning tolloid-like protein 1 [Stegodyphus dumicola]
MDNLWLLMVALLCLLNSFKLNVKGDEEDDDELEEEYLYSSKGLQILTELNPTETEDGKPIVEGDIVLPPGSKRPNEIEEHKGIVNILTIWTNGKVSYNFHSSVDDNLKAMIVDAMGEWEKHTCLKFTEKAIDFNYLRFRADQEGCWSMIGKINTIFAGQDVSIGPGCNRSNIIVHEIGHAIGFYHEQSRNDRDRYIHILWNNMPVARYSQFDKGIENPRGVEYDFTSVMHYGPMRNGSIFTAYRKQFKAGCPNNNQSQCLNGGFLSPYRGDNQPCHCVCPPKSSGEFCEYTEEPFEYYDLPPCGGNITEDTEISTPGYPNRQPPADSCSWWMQAPEGKRVQVEFIDFSFHPRMESNKTIFNQKCVKERVEIRTRSRYDGDMFCGEDIPPGTVATSAECEFIIIIDTNEKAQAGRGLKAKVTFVDEEETEYSEKTLASLLP